MKRNGAGDEHSDSLRLLAIVGELGFVHVEKVQPAIGPEGDRFTKLSNTRDAWGYSFLGIADYNAVFSAWDVTLLLQLSGVGSGHSALTAGLGSLMAEGDYRLGIGVEFTRLQNLSLGMNYSGFLGDPHFRRRPYQDRDTLSFIAKYSF